MMKLSAEVRIEDVLDYFEDVDIDLGLRNPEKFRATMMFVGLESKPVINIFDDEHNIAWYIETATRKVARCKNGKWSRFYDADTLDVIQPPERML